MHVQRGRDVKQLPAELGLQVRMALAALVSLALLVAAVGLCTYIVVSEPDGRLLVAAMPALCIAGWISSWRRARRRSWRSLDPDPDDVERAGAQLTRLAMLVDAATPRVAVDRNRAPLSWTTALPRRTPTVHVTTGLLARLDDRELQAVLAHEFAHVLHRDAVVMTLLAAPPAYLLAGLRSWADDGVLELLTGAFIGVLLVPPAALMLAVARIVSRHRELAADRGAAVLTGVPERVAAALLAVESALDAMPRRDLRIAAARDDFHFVPARPAGLLRRPWATHPPTAKRIARLERYSEALARDRADA
jgi:heat shock protein HtpX